MQSPVCGALGVCVSESECMCQATGDIGVGDFVYGSPSCSLSATAITVLYAICAALQFFGTLFSVYYLHISIRRFKLVHRKNMIGFFSLIMTTCLLVMTLRRAIAPETTAIGSDVASSVLFSIGAFCFHQAAFFNSTGYAALVLRQNCIKDSQTKEKIDRLNSVTQMAQPLHVFLNLCANTMPIIMLSATSRTSMFAFASVHYLCSAAMISSMGLVIFPLVINPLIQDLEEVARIRPVGDADQAAFRQVSRKLKAFVNDMKGQGIFNIVIAVSFGCWPFLQNFSAYWLPIAWMSGCHVLLRALNAELPVKLAGKSTGDSSAIRSGHENVKLNVSSLEQDQVA